MQEELEIAGYPEAVLFVTSSAPDTDFFVRLIDEDPDGKALEVCYGMVRVRHRHSLDREELIAPGDLVELRVKLGATACNFRRGHCLRLELTSSDFPNHDRNHNTGGNDLAEVDLAVARQTVFHGGDRPSRLILPAAGA